MAQGVSGVAAGTVAVGIVFVWSGVRGTSVLLTVQDIIRGNQPSKTVAHPINLPDPPAPRGGGPGGSSGGGGGGTVSPPRSGGGGGGGGSGGGGGGGGLKLPPINPPKVAPPRSAPPLPKTHIAPPPKKDRPWYDPRGWF